MKILYITTIGSTMDFFRSLIGELVEEGNTVDIATNDTYSKVDDYFVTLGCKVYSISCSRSPFNLGNVKAIKEIRKIVSDGQYDIVHCHTPIAAAATRLACRKLRKKEHPVKVIYTAHGFHFYKGAPLKNWLIFYPIEKICAHWTDVLITINKEDYARAQKKLKAKKIEYVPGVGIDTDKFNGNRLTEQEKDNLRQSIGVPKEAFLMLSVGELNENKNHEVVIRAVAEIVRNDANSNVCYAIAGKGDRAEYLSDLANEMGVGGRVKLLGFRSDVAELMQVADIYLLPSLREGLNVSLMEAMASGLPCICGKIRGNVDLIDEPEGGAVVLPADVISWSEEIRKIYKYLKSENELMGRYNADKIKAYSSVVVNKQMKTIYR